MTTMDTKEIYISRLPQHTSDDSPYLSSDLSQPALSSRIRTPSTRREWRAAMYCTISTRTTETDQRRFAKKAQIKFPTHGLVGSSLLRRFARLPAWTTGIYLPMPWNFSFLFLFSLCLDYIFCPRGELAKDEALFFFSLFFCCMCATVVYPPQPTQGSCMYEGQPG